MADAFACSGCGLCLLVCPVWRETRDIRHSPLGRAKALQNGAAAADVALSVQSCTLCGACEPACPAPLGAIRVLPNLPRRLP